MTQIGFKSMCKFYQKKIHNIITSLSVLVIIEDVCSSQQIFTKFCSNMPDYHSFWTPEGKWSYKIILVYSSTSVEGYRRQKIIIVRPSVSTQIISKTALTIFLKLCMMLDIQKAKKLTRPDFPKKSRFIHKVRKRPFLRGFWRFSRKRL
jgi:hypothetical protein